LMVYILPCYAFTIGHGSIIAFFTLSMLNSLDSRQ